MEARLIAAAALAWGATAVSALGYVFSNSVVVLGDFLHGVTDALGITLAVLVAWLVARDPGGVFTYGYHRAESLAIFTNAVTILFGSIYVAYEAALRFFKGVEIDPLWMLYSSSAALILSVGSAVLLKGRSEANLKAAYLHALADSLTSIIALASAVSIILAGIPLIDAVLGLGISAYLFSRALPLFKSSLLSLLDASPINPEALKKEIGLHVHDMHIWSPCPDFKIATLHIVVPENYTLTELEEIRKRVEHTLRSRGINHVTIQFESGHCSNSHRH
ncbi:MAG: cation diffusion facilitator family transporter [Pyrobaculum sp.]